jgi:hypothetical protein
MKDGFKTVTEHTHIADTSDGPSGTHSSTETELTSARRRSERGRGGMNKFGKFQANLFSAISGIDENIDISTR